jgi:hypothetical protein
LEESAIFVGLNTTSFGLTQGRQVCFDQVQCFQTNISKYIKIAKKEALNVCEFQRCKKKASELLDGKD